MHVGSFLLFFINFSNTYRFEIIDKKQYVEFFFANCQVFFFFEFGSCMNKVKHVSILQNNAQNVTFL